MSEEGGTVGTSGASQEIALAKLQGYDLPTQLAPCFRVLVWRMAISFSTFNFFGQQSFNSKALHHGASTMASVIDGLRKMVSIRFSNRLMAKRSSRSSHWYTYISAGYMSFNRHKYMRLFCY